MPTGAAERTPTQSSLEAIDIQMLMKASPGETLENFLRVESHNIYTEDCARRVYRGYLKRRSRRLSVEAERGQCLQDRARTAGGWGQPEYRDSQ